jgi:predicted nuclease of predicted toxin-antitoxin system
VPRYLVDANLPYYFSVWNGPDFVHAKDLDDQWSDSEIWRYALEHDLTIVTKDADFSDRVMVTDPPPRVIHVKLGNLRMRDFHRAISAVWPEACELSRSCRLVRIFTDRIEGIV